MYLCIYVNTLVIVLRALGSSEAHCRAERRAYQQGESNPSTYIHTYITYISTITMIQYMHHNRIAQSKHLSYFQVFYYSLLQIHHTLHFHFLHTYIHTLQVILRGLPVRPAFWKPAATTDKSKLRKQLGLATDAGRKTVLLMGGGDGVGGIENIACEVTAPSLEILRIITTTR